jgi:hypothetical protein
MLAPLVEKRRRKMGEFSTPTQRVILAIRIARDAAGIRNRDIVTAITKRQQPSANYDEQRLKHDFAQKDLGQRVLDRIVLGTFDAVMAQESDERRAAARWFLSEMERMGHVQIWDEADATTQGILQTLSSGGILQKGAEERARRLITGELRKELGPMEIGPL